MGSQSFYISLLGVLSEIVVLGAIWFVYLREREKEKYLLFWMIAFSLIFFSEFVIVLFYLQVLKYGILLKQIFQITATFLLMWGVLGLSFREQFRFKGLFAIAVLFIILLCIASEIHFKDRWKYVVSLALIPPVSFFSGLKMISIAKRLKFPSYKIFGFAIILWGIVPISHFIFDYFINKPSYSLLLRYSVVEFIGISILVLVIDRFFAKAIYMEKLYHTITDAMNEALVLLDPEEKIIYINNRFCDLMRCKNPNELKGKSFLDFVPERFKQIVMEKTRMRMLGVSDTYEIELKDMEGGVHNVIISGAPYYDEFGIFKGTIGIILDITEKRKLEIDYQMASKLAAIGELAAGIAHNIKNPLQGIVLVAETLKRKNVEPYWVDILIKQAERINSIINNLQFKAFMDSRTDVQVIDLNVLLREELKFLEAHRFFKHEIEKDFNFTDEPLLVRGIYSDFSQIFSNIIKNAIDAMYSTDRKILTVKTYKDDGFAVVEIGDTGVGIPDEILPKIWDMFFTTKPTIYARKGDEPVGTGIGLATVKRLLEKYSGKVEVKTKVGEGTTFILKFPIATNSN